MKPDLQHPQPAATAAASASCSCHRAEGTALATVFSRSGEAFGVSRFPLPRPGAGEVLVRVTCATICGSDVHTWAGRRNEPTPCVLGHEIVGTIAAFGDDAPARDLRGEPLAIGDRVVWTLAASCGTCFFCRRDLPQKCETLVKYGHMQIRSGSEFSGGFAEYCLLAAGTGILKVPASLPDALAAPANCAVATVAACCRLAGPLDGALVVVIGCGVLGTLACAMARSLGASVVVACDRAAEREAAARAFGADHFTTPAGLDALARRLSDGRGADVVIELSGASSSVAAAIEVSRTGGTAVIAGTTTPCEPVALDPHQLMRRMLTIRGLHNYAPRDLVSAVDFLESHAAKLPFGDLHGGSFPLREIDRAFAAAAASPGTRVALIP
jgi:alcohol dehydrogenase